MIRIITGGLFVPIHPHFALAAPAFGTIGQHVAGCMAAALAGAKMEVPLHLIRTEMSDGGYHSSYQDALMKAAGIKRLFSNDDLEKLLDYLVNEEKLEGPQALLMPVAVCDWEPVSVETYPNVYEGEGPAPYPLPSHQRISTRVIEHAHLKMKPSEKLIRKIRAVRKDIFVVGWSQTTGASREVQYRIALEKLKKGSLNLVFANDLDSGRNMVVAPEETTYGVFEDRFATLNVLCNMVVHRMQNHFTRTTVELDERALIPWNSSSIPEVFKTVVERCISAGAYKPFLGSTAGHFGLRVGESYILSTVRKSNINKIASKGMVACRYKGNDWVLAAGAKPSVGGQSQRRIFDAHPDMDCIVHFHCPLRPGSTINVRPQIHNECGSHECGINTAEGLVEVAPGIKVVMLDNHGPNVVFNSTKVTADQVWNVIEQNFDLKDKTGGLLS